MKQRKVSHSVIRCLAAAGAVGCVSSIPLACGGPCFRVADLDFEPPALEAYPDALPAGGAPFAIVGDTQRTSVQECVIGREVNDAETTIIIDGIAKAKPAFLVHLGDLVFHGASETHWQFFDHIARPLRDESIPILPLMGNHEYWGNNASAREHVKARFPRLQDQTWYADRHQHLGLVWLDSNRDELPEGTWSKQVKWFNEAMDELDGRDDVRGILLFAHHAPFTNSNVVDPDQSVQSDFVARFCESPKALAMMTGHAHGYERFVRGPNEGCGSRDILFMVSAGGGGPRSDSLRPASETGFTDAFAGPAPRPFHFVMVAQSDDGVTLTVHGMDKGESETRVIESLTLPF